MKVFIFFLSILLVYGAPTVEDLAGTLSVDQSPDKSASDDESESETQQISSNCDAVVAIFEIYNATSEMLADIRSSVPNVVIWDGGMTFVPIDENFEEVWKSGDKLDVVYNQEVQDPKKETAEPAQVVLIGVPPSMNDSLLMTFSILGVNYKDLEYRLCVRYLKPDTDPSELGDYSGIMAFANRDPTLDEFPNRFTIPSHITFDIYPEIFYNILISSEPEFSSASSPPTRNPLPSPFFPRQEVTSLFTYYISHDNATGVISVEHGTIPADACAKWAWLPSLNDPNKYHLVNAKEPNSQVVADSDGNLVLVKSPSSNNDNNDATGPDLQKPLEFSLNFSGNEFALITELDKEKHCVVQYFASTLRLMPFREDDQVKDSEEQECTRFRLKLGEITVMSGKHNVTFLDLYSTQATEWVDLGQMGIDIRFTENSESTVILYFTSEPTTLDLFLSNLMWTSRLEDLYLIADASLPNSTICNENFLQNENDLKPVLTCRLPEEEVISRPNASEKLKSLLDEVPVYRRDSRQKILRGTTVQLFRNFGKFQFLVDGLKPCENESEGRCAQKKGAMLEAGVEDMLKNMGVGYSNIVKEEGGDNLFYWGEGLVTFMNVTMAPENEQEPNNNSV